jgi:hypothetical protein
MNFIDLPNRLIIDLHIPYTFLSTNLGSENMFCIDLECIMEGIFEIISDTENVDDDIRSYLDWLVYEGLDLKSDVPREQVELAVSIIEKTIRKILCILNTLGYSSLREFPYMLQYIRNDGTTYLSKV